ncbi:MAG TPA: (2Fe-2S)-binding protein [Trueperaceae bacterium]|nr:(2Fe-2S)-binding protein [Trueperaceae bacterium]
MRVTDHPLLPPLRRREVRFSFEGREVVALEGESIAAALLASGERVLRFHERTGAPRGLYCGIGHCLECRVWVEGVGTVRACTTRVEDGMRVRRAGSGEGG